MYRERAGQHIKKTGEGFTHRLLNSGKSVYETIQDYTSERRTGREREYDGLRGKRADFRGSSEGDGKGGIARFILYCSEAKRVDWGEQPSAPWKTANCTRSRGDSFFARTAEWKRGRRATSVWKKKSEGRVEMPVRKRF